MSSIFEISKEYTELMLKIESSEGELDEQTLQQLESNEEDFVEKCKNYRHIIKKWENDVELIKKERDRLSALMKKTENNIERLKNNIDYVLKQRDLEELDLGIHGRISYRKSFRTNIDEDKLLKKYKTKQVIYKVDKNEIKKLLKEGVEIKGAELETIYNLQVK